MRITGTAAIIYDVILERVPELVNVVSANDMIRLQQAIIAGLLAAEDAEQLYSEELERGEQITD